MQTRRSHAQRLGHAANGGGATQYSGGAYEHTNTNTNVSMIGGRGPTVVGVRTSSRPTSPIVGARRMTSPVVGSGTPNHTSSRPAFTTSTRANASVAANRPFGTPTNGTISSKRTTPTRTHSSGRVGGGVGGTTASTTAGGARAMVPNTYAASAIATVAAANFARDNTTGASNEGWVSTPRHPRSFANSHGGPNNSSNTNNGRTTPIRRTTPLRSGGGTNTSTAQQQPMPTPNAANRGLVSLYQQTKSPARTAGGAATTPIGARRAATTGGASSLVAVQGLESFVAEVVGIRMQSMNDLKQRLDDLARLQRAEEDAFREQMNALLLRSEHVRASHESVEEHYESLLAKEKGERVRAVQLMQRFKAEGSTVMEELKEALATVQGKYQQEVERNAKLTSQLMALQQQVLMGKGGAATTHDETNTVSTASAGPSSSSASLEAKIATLTTILEEEDAIIDELKQRNKLLEARCGEAMREKERMAEALAAMNQSANAADAEYNNLLKQLGNVVVQQPVGGSQRPESPLPNDPALLTSPTGGLTTPPPQQQQLANGHQKVALLNQFAASVVAKLKAEQRQRLFTEEQSAKVVEAQERMIRKLEGRVKEAEDKAVMAMNRASAVGGGVTHQQQNSAAVQHQHSQQQPQNTRPVPALALGKVSPQKPTVAPSPQQHRQQQHSYQPTELNTTPKGLSHTRALSGSVGATTPASAARHTASDDASRDAAMAAFLSGRGVTAAATPTTIGAKSRSPTAGITNVQSKLEMYRSSPRRVAVTGTGGAVGNNAAPVAGSNGYEDPSIDEIASAVTRPIGSSIVGGAQPDFAPNQPPSASHPTHPINPSVAYTQSLLLRSRRSASNESAALEDDLQRRLAAVTADFQQSIEEWSHALAQRPVAVGVVVGSTVASTAASAPHEAEDASGYDDHHGGGDGEVGGGGASGEDFAPDEAGHYEADEGHHHHHHHDDGVGGYEAYYRDPRTLSDEGGDAAHRHDDYRRRSGAVEEETTRDGEVGFGDDEEDHFDGDAGDYGRGNNDDEDDFAPRDGDSVPPPRTAQDYHHASSAANNQPIDLDDEFDEFDDEDDDFAPQPMPPQD